MVKLLGRFPYHIKACQRLCVVLQDGWQVQPIQAPDLLVDMIEVPVRLAELANGAGAVVFSKTDPDE